MHPYLQKLHKVFCFNYLILSLFIITVVFFRIKSPHLILTSNRSVVLKSMNPSTNTISRTIGDSFDSRIIKYINDFYTVQNPDCDYDCADNCIKQTSSRKHTKDFTKNYFESCIVEDCSCEMVEHSQKNTNGVINIFMLIATVSMLYFAVIISSQSPSKSLKLGYEKLYEEELETGEMSNFESYTINLLE
mmetsp:Transcript_13719/g.14279  ORF Transcript_13719/g.14279 Transcript_13719/m.14279 type:complete len:190 (+) Transcript_13719:6-575(+)